MRKAGIDVQWVRFEMKFKKPAKTSRGTLMRDQPRRVSESTKWVVDRVA